MQGERQDRKQALLRYTSQRFHAKTQEIVTFAIALPPPGRDQLQRINFTWFNSRKDYSFSGAATYSLALDASVYLMSERQLETACSQAVESGGAFFSINLPRNFHHRDAEPEGR
jgi:hypothetical protein